jgi:hypothetical protein
MRILHLIIHLQQGAYRAMYDTLSEFYRQFDNVDTYFLCFDLDMRSEYRIDGDLLWIRGAESLVPGILQKTIDGMLRFELTEYDYVVRSNSSTVVDFYQFAKYETSFKSEGADYLCAQKLRLAWLDPPSGIKDSKYFGTDFGTGAMIVLSQRAALALLEKRHFLDYSIVDDVAIGIFFKNIFPSKIYTFTGPRYAMNIRRIPMDQRKALIDGLMKTQPVAWRNKSSDRFEDSLSMRYICARISAENISHPAA